MTSYFFRNLLKLGRLLFKVAWLRKRFSRFCSLTELTRLVFGENFLWFLLCKETENALISSTVQNITAKQTARVRNKLNDDLIVLLHDSSKVNKSGWLRVAPCVLICARVLIFWCAASLFIRCSCYVTGTVLIAYLPWLVSPLLCRNYPYFVGIASSMTRFMTGIQRLNMEQCSESKNSCKRSLFWKVSCILEQHILFQ